MTWLRGQGDVHDEMDEMRAEQVGKFKHFGELAKSIQVFVCFDEILLNF